MNKLIILSLTVLVALGVPSCKKDDPVKYGVDGKTPLPKAVSGELLTLDLRLQAVENALSDLLE